MYEWRKTDNRYFVHLKVFATEELWKLFETETFWDLTLVAKGFGTDSLEGDVNRDGFVNILDLVFVANQSEEVPKSYEA